MRVLWLVLLVGCASPEGAKSPADCAAHNGCGRIEDSPHDWGAITGAAIVVAAVFGIGIIEALATKH